MIDFDAIDADFDLEADLNESDDLDGLIETMRDGDGAEVYRFN